MSEQLIKNLGEVNLPEYSVSEINGFTPSVLTTEANNLGFPLSEEDVHDIVLLKMKFESESNIAGLAAPQIGIAKKIIIFEAIATEKLKKWRPDFTQSMNKTIWINPLYTGIEEFGFHEDIEGCFSVKNFRGNVVRYNKINYRAYDFDGNLIEGTAEGFLARIIQHEIDHVYGKLFISYIAPEKLALPRNETKSP